VRDPARAAAHGRSPCASSTATSTRARGAGEAHRREEFPEAYVSTSHEVAPEFREYERLSTVVVNAYLGPVMSSYLGRLRPRLAHSASTRPPHLTQSNGGVISFETAQENPVRAVLSGPSTGWSARSMPARSPGSGTSSPSTWAGRRPTCR
jgi:hypothetical protein